jgi:hypothetical protein
LGLIIATFSISLPLWLKNKNPKTKKTLMHTRYKIIIFIFIFSAALTSLPRVLD